MKLRAVDGPLKGREVKIERFPAVIGRSDVDADVVLGDDPRISRRHCRIEQLNDEFWIEDLGSNNGTWVERRRVTERTRLEPDALVHIGDSDLAVLIGADQPVRVSDALDTAEMSTRTMDPTTVQIRLADVLAEAPATTPGQTRTNEFRIDAVEVERLRSRLRVLLQVAEASTQQLDLQQLFDIATDGILDATLASRAAVLLPDDDGELIPVVARNQGGDKRQVEVSRTIVKRAVDDRMTVLVQDARADSTLATAESVQLNAIRSAICAPMMLDGRVRAVFYVDASLPRAFTDDELQLVTAIANQAAVAMSNAGLSNQLESICHKLRSARQHKENMIDLFRTLSRTG